MIAPRFKGRVEKGKIAMEGYTQQVFTGYLHTLSGFVEVVVKPWKDKKDRSNEQNRYMWGVIYKLISDETGHSVDEVHEIFKLMFLAKIVTIGKIPQVISESTTKITTSEMEEYLSKIREFAAFELGLNIPEPGEVSLA